MNQPMHKLDPLFQGYMLGAAIRIAYTMQSQLLHAIMTREKERLTEGARARAYSRELGGLQEPAE